jgi:hypothetical protein
MEGDEEAVRDPYFLNDQIIHYAYIQIPFYQSRCAYCHWSSGYDDAIDTKVT